MRVGRDTNAQAFRDDWILVHEMVHLAVPRLARAHNWLHEGLATYEAGDRFDHTAAEGFIKIWGLPVEIAARKAPVPPPHCRRPAVARE